MSQTITRRRYTEEQITRGLHELALCSGNTRLASRRLAERGLTIPYKTLHQWKQTTHADRYQRVVNDVLPKVYDRIAQENERLAEEYAEAERVALEQFHATAKDMKGGESSTAARNFGVGKGIAIERASTIRGRPTQIREDRKLTDLLRALEARFPAVVETVDSTATEVDPPTLPASSSPQRTDTDE